ncbi:hypothetical protein [Helcococcus kunzii]|uniref:hypothetical protein n=1 Tax=Helcococcus kunzii TaxID=40091 RepID=UPI0024ACE7A0|nr:hypothetical protein [Helcococcus kunzii]
MNILDDILKVNKEAFTETLKKLKFVPILAMILFVFKIAEFYILFALTGYNQASSFILGFVRAAVSIAFLSALISFLADIVIYNRLDFNNFLNRFSEYFSPLMNTYFIIFLIEMVVNMLFGALPRVISLIISIALLVLQSPLYEEVYLGNTYGMDAVYSAFDFIKENFLQWLPVLIAYVLIEYVFSFWSIIMVFDLRLIIQSILYGLLLAFVYIYKGQLFKILNGSSMRKRRFQGKF